MGQLKAYFKKKTKNPDTLDVHHLDKIALLYPPLINEDTQKNLKNKYT